MDSQVEPKKMDPSLSSSSSYWIGRVASLQHFVEKPMDERLMRFTDSEWKEVEKRFNRLASAGNGPEPVVKWSEFGFCIGI